MEARGNHSPGIGIRGGWEPPNVSVEEKGTKFGSLARAV